MAQDMGRFGSFFDSRNCSLLVSICAWARAGWRIWRDGCNAGGIHTCILLVVCGTFAWGVDSISSGSKWWPKVIGAHFEFMASALDGKISLGCDWATWRAYVSGFVSLMVGCTQVWMSKVDMDVLKRLSKGLRQWNEEELALALLGRSGIGAMGAAAELIICNK
ncbi:hypothetical protein IFM89_014822 [Coptis chinensis]|uniref:Uncharacterized protein n=1 Tax=Coptis chinensis TaxID=261450 RepID=A0A835ICU6_9MAGN|nr:hypothetical protein IFM89_014822 [Coptis chinensis]